MRVQRRALLPTTFTYDKTDETRKQTIEKFKKKWSKYIKFRSRVGVAVANKFETKYKKKETVRVDQIWSLRIIAHGIKWMKAFIRES